MWASQGNQTLKLRTYRQCQTAESQKTCFLQQSLSYAQYFPHEVVETKTEQKVYIELELNSLNINGKYYFFVCLNWTKEYFTAALLFNTWQRFRVRQIFLFHCSWKLSITDTLNLNLGIQTPIIYGSKFLLVVLFWSYNAHSTACSLAFFLKTQIIYFYISLIWYSIKLKILPKLNYF